MPETFQITIRGARQLREAFERLPDQAMPRRIQLAALRAGGAPIVGRAWELAPKSGRPEGLADSIKIRAVSSRQSGPGTTAVAIGPDRKHFYGYFHEYGTRKMRARRFMRPAWDQHKGPAPRRIGDSLWEQIAKVAATYARRSPTGTGL